jgi:hypothetical protein
MSKLPELPVPYSTDDNPFQDGEGRALFADYQMRAYAEQAIASVKREPLSEEQIASIYATWDRTPGASFADLFRAIEAAHGITGRYKELK